MYKSLLKCVLILLIFDRNWQHDICLALLHNLKCTKVLARDHVSPFSCGLIFTRDCMFRSLDPLCLKNGKKDIFFIVRLLGEKQTLQARHFFSSYNQRCNINSQTAWCSYRFSSKCVWQMFNFPASAILPHRAGILSSGSVGYSCLSCDFLPG